MPRKSSKLIRSGADYQNRNWVFTYYKIDVPLDFSKHPIVRFAEWQLEECPTTKRRHFQGYFVCEQNIKKPAADKIVFCEEEGSRTYVSGMKFDLKYSENYCSKDKTKIDGPWTYGERPRQGERTDILDIYERIKEGADNEKLGAEFGWNYMRNRTFFDLYRINNLPSRTWKTNCYVLWGPRGSGKSTKAKQLMGTEDKKIVFTKRKDNKWWDGYNQHPIVFIDEFIGQLDMQEMNMICGTNEHTVEYKGGTLPYLAKDVYICSEYHWSKWWGKKTGRIEDYPHSFERRITRVYQFNTTRPEGYPNFETEIID